MNVPGEELGGEGFGQRIDGGVGYVKQSRAW
jgi:hypothetical protein